MEDFGKIDIDASGARTLRVCDDERKKTENPYNPVPFLKKQGCTGKDEDLLKDYVATMLASENLRALTNTVIFAARVAVYALGKDKERRLFNENQHTIQSLFTSYMIYGAAMFRFGSECMDEEAVMRDNIKRVRRFRETQTMHTNGDEVGEFEDGEVDTRYLNRIVDITETHFLSSVHMRGCEFFYSHRPDDDDLIGILQAHGWYVYAGVPGRQPCIATYRPEKIRRHLISNAKDRDDLMTGYCVKITPRPKEEIRRVLAEPQGAGVGGDPQADFSDTERLIEQAQKLKTGSSVQYVPNGFPLPRALKDSAVRGEVIRHEFHQPAHLQCEEMAQLNNPNLSTEFMQIMNVIIQQHLGVNGERVTGKVGEGEDVVEWRRWQVIAALTPYITAVCVFSAAITRLGCAAMVEVAKDHIQAIFFPEAEEGKGEGAAEDKPSGSKV